jgi:hypothetical protein
MQAEQVNQPNQAAEAAMPANQKAFADLLFTMMDVIEKYQEGENGDGNYLTAMNALRDLHKFREQLRSGNTGAGVVFQYYEAVHRAPAPAPVRARAARKKMNDDEKRAAGYVPCPKCGRLFSDNSKLKRHQDTTEICRHIVHEKEVAIQTGKVERKKIVLARRASHLPRKVAEMPPENAHITKQHAYYGAFVHSMLLFLEGRKHQVELIQAIWRQAYQVSWMNSEDPDAQVKMRKENLYDAYRHRMVHEGGVTIPKLIME